MPCLQKKRKKSPTIWASNCPKSWNGTRMTGHDIGIMAEKQRDEDNFAPIDWLADHDAEPSRQLSKQAHYALQTEGLQNALAQLDDRSRRIVESRWLQDDGGLTLHELAAEYGVSAERIRQIEAKAMAKTARFLGRRSRSRLSLS